MSETVIGAGRYTDRDLIESIINNYFIIDYGYISKVNDDKTINVIHAKKPFNRYGQELKAMETKNIEVLTLSGASFSIKWDIKQGDKVLLLGFKDYVAKVADVTQPTAQTIHLHYDRECLKAFPISAFNEESKVTIDISEGVFNIDAQNSINLNGDSKSFVTYDELNNALQAIWAAIQTHTHVVSVTGPSGAMPGTASASIELSTQTLDISASKTTTVKTGG